MRKNDLLAVCTGIPIAIFLALIVNSRYSMLIEQKAYLLLLFTYGGIVSFDGLDLFSTLLFCIPFMFQVLLLSNDLHRDFSIASVYIFTRKDTRNKWLLNKYILLELKSWLYYCAQFLTIIMISIIWGYSFDLIKIVTVILLLIATMVIMNTLWVLLGCSFSIKKSNPSIISGILAVYIGWIFLLPVIKYTPQLLKVIPITRSLLSVHESSFFDSIHIDMPITLTILGTCLWASIARIVIYLLSNKWIRNTDLI